MAQEQSIPFLEQGLLHVVNLTYLKHTFIGTVLYV